MHAIKRTLDFIGDVVPYTSRNGVTIQLQWIRSGVYRVEVLTSGPVAQLVDDLCGSFDTEQGARDAARFLAVVNDAEADGTDVAEMLNIEVTGMLAEAMRRRDSRRVAQLNRLADRFETPAERALAVDINAHLDAIADAEALPPAKSLRELRDRHAAGMERDRRNPAA